MFSAPIGQWQGHDQGEDHAGKDGGEGSGRNPTRSEEQPWEWQPGHEDLTLEEEINQGGMQEDGSEPEQEEEDDFEEMLAGWLEFFQE
eukprot:13886115-Heterocapsa_arctica.AAC.1